MHFSTLLIKGLFFWYFQQYIHQPIIYLQLTYSELLKFFLIAKYVCSLIKKYIEDYDRFLIPKNTDVLIVSVFIISKHNFKIK